jgi:hypothetical protein
VSAHLPRCAARHQLSIFPTYLFYDAVALVGSAARHSSAQVNEAQLAPFPGPLAITNPVNEQEPGLANPANVLVRAPLRNRTVDLLLTIYPRDDAVANWDDAGQVRGGALCCRPTYLFITRHRRVMIGVSVGDSA